MDWTSTPPAKSGLYGFRPLDEAPRVVEVDLGDDKIWEETCQRALSTFRRPEFRVLWCGPLKTRDDELPPLPE